MLRTNPVHSTRRGLVTAGRRLGVWVALAGGVLSLACTYEEDSCAGGSCECPDVGSGEGDGGPPPVRYIVIQDNSEAGPAPWSDTIGIDVCGVVADCGGQSVVGRSAKLTQGFRGLCQGEECAALAERDDARAALDDGARCELSGEQSAFVSLGAEGTLFIDFGVDLRGCTVTLREFADESAGEEAFTLHVCHTPELDGCGCRQHFVRPARDTTVAVPPG